MTDTNAKAEAGSVICPSCGAANLPGSRFCSTCATPLARAATPAVEARKTVTVLFCDATSSTALGERLDPESLRGLMTRYFDVMREVIDAEGFISHLAGDLHSARQLILDAYEAMTASGDRSFASTHLRAGPAQDHQRPGALLRDPEAGARDAGRAAFAAAEPHLVAADGLHPSGAQYALWVEAIRPVVERLLGIGPASIGPA